MAQGTRKNFVFTEDDQARLERLSREIGCSSTDVVRYGLIALKTLVNQGYEFRDLHRTTIFRRSPGGRTIAFFAISEDGALVDQGRIAQWPNAPDDEGAT